MTSSPKVALPGIDTPAVVDFDRGICSDGVQATQREWMVTNGLGGYGCGTISGILTRCYHGWLVAALNPPVGRSLLLTKLDEVVEYGGVSYPLSCDRWGGGTTTGHGYRNIERFHLEGTTPTWTYACADALLQKRIWMQPGENTTYVQYRLLRASAPFSLRIKALVNHRDHHHVTNSHHGPEPWKIETRSHPRGLKVLAEGCEPFYLFSTRGKLQPYYKWYQHYFLTQEKYRGLPHLDDHFHCASLRTTLQPGETVTIAASTEAFPNLDEASVPEERIRYEEELYSLGGAKRGLSAVEGQLLLAADQFIVARSVTDPDTKEQTDGKTVIAGYPWFGDWGRDTMIALPGLTIATGRATLARPILKTFSRYLSQGMLPNAFPEAGSEPGYNTVDAILWYFEAIRAYVEATDDHELLEDLFPALEEVIDWHLRGTRYNIHLDQADGLLYAGEQGSQLTWMDAKVDGWVVTPRIGKPVEINALWHNALRCMAEFCDRLQRPPDDYLALAQFAATSFGKFWQADKGYCYDVIDGPQGNDSALRPNQLFAVSLRYAPPLSAMQQKSVVDRCAQELVTSHGLRSLSQSHTDYIGTYTGNQLKRDGSYHQGTTWGWLMGPFVQAHYKVYGNKEIACSFLESLCCQVHSGCVGTLGEIFDGDAPFVGRGAFAQAWSVAEVLRVWQLLANAETKE
ncbi:MAG: amylo-alpha-1,6-glucosidase [Cyanobacteria bacterium J06648_10]